MRLRTSNTWFAAVTAGFVVAMVVFAAICGLAVLFSWQPTPLLLFSITVVVGVGVGVLTLRASTVELTPATIRRQGLRGAGTAYPYTAYVGSLTEGAPGEQTESYGVIVVASGAERGPLAKPYLVWTCASPAHVADSGWAWAVHARKLLHDVVQVIEADGARLPVERFDLVHRRAMLRMLGRGDE